MGSEMCIRDSTLEQEQERDTNAPKQFRLKSSRGQQHAVSIVDLDLDMPTSATTSPCRANQYPDGRDPDVFVDLAP